MAGSGIADSPHPIRSEVGCELRFAVAECASLAVQVAVGRSAGLTEVDDLVVTLNGEHLETDAVCVDHGGRVHVVRCAAGELVVRYRAVVAVGPPAQPVDAAEALIAVRQSRYCPSDRLTAFAEATFGRGTGGPDRGRDVGDWVFDRLRYELGSSGPLDTAVDTLLAGRGVCRDFAHLTIALCRAIGIPARLASVYAPGLWPMDFHAVAEVAVDGRWELIDATRLAPRQSLVRIATGRDAADTAFATTLSGSVELTSSMVTAFVLGNLPFDDHRPPIALA